MSGYTVFPRRTAVPPKRLPLDADDPLQLLSDPAFQFHATNTAPLFTSASVSAPGVDFSSQRDQHGPARTARSQADQQVAGGGPATPLRPSSAVPRRGPPMESSPAPPHPPGSGARHATESTSWLSPHTNGTATGLNPFSATHTQPATVSARRSQHSAAEQQHRPQPMDGQGPAPVSSSSSTATATTSTTTTGSSSSGGKSYEGSSSFMVLEGQPHAVDEKKKSKSNGAKERRRGLQLKHLSVGAPQGHRAVALTPRQAHAKELLYTLQHPPEAVSSHSSALTAASSSLCHHPTESNYLQHKNTTILGLGGLTAELVEARANEAAARAGGHRHRHASNQRTKELTALQLLLGEGEDVENVFLPRPQDVDGSGGVVPSEEGTESTPGLQKGRRRRHHRHVDVAAAGAAGATSFNLLDTRRCATLYVEAPTPKPKPSPRGESLSLTHSAALGPTTATQPGTSATGLNRTLPTRLPDTGAAPAGDESPAFFAAVGRKIRERIGKHKRSSVGRSGGVADAEGDQLEDTVAYAPPSAHTVGAAPREDSQHHSGGSAGGAPVPAPAPAAAADGPGAPPSARDGASSATTQSTPRLDEAPQTHHHPRVLHAGLPPLRSHLYFERDGVAMTEAAFREAEAAQSAKDEGTAVSATRRHRHRSSVGGGASRPPLAPAVQVKLDPSTGIPLLAPGQQMAGGGGTNYYTGEQGLQWRTQQQLAAGGAFDRRRCQHGDPYSVCLLAEEDTDLFLPRNPPARGGGDGDGDGDGDDPRPPDGAHRLANPKAYRYFYHKLLHKLLHVSVVLSFLACGAAAIICLVAFSPMWRKGVDFVVLLSHNASSTATKGPSDLLLAPQPAAQHPVASAIVPRKTQTEANRRASADLEDISSSAPLRSAAERTDSSNTPTTDPLALQLLHRPKASLLFYLVSDIQPAFFIFFSMLCIITHLGTMTAPWVDTYWRHHRRRLAKTLRSGLRSGMPPVGETVSAGTGVGSAVTMANVAWKRQFFDVYQHQLKEEDKVRQREAQREARKKRRREKDAQKRTTKKRQLVQLLRRGRRKKKDAAPGAAQAAADAEPLGEEMDEATLHRELERLRREADEAALWAEEAQKKAEAAAAAEAAQRAEDKAAARALLRHDFNFLAFQRRHGATKAGAASRRAAAAAARRRALQQQRQDTAPAFGGAPAASRGRLMMRRATTVPLFGFDADPDSSVGGGAVLSAAAQQGSGSGSGFHRFTKALRPIRQALMGAAGVGGRGDAATPESPLGTSFSGGDLWSGEGPGDGSPLRRGPGSAFGGTSDGRPGGDEYTDNTSSHIHRTVDPDTPSSLRIPSGGKIARGSSRRRASNATYLYRAAAEASERAYSSAADEDSMTLPVDPFAVNFGSRRPGAAYRDDLAASTEDVLTGDGGSSGQYFVAAPFEGSLSRRRRRTSGANSSTGFKSALSTSIPFSASMYAGGMSDTAEYGSGGAGTPHRPAGCGSGSGAYSFDTQSSSSEWSRGRAEEDGQTASFFSNPKHFSPLWRRLCGRYLSLYHKHPSVFFMLDRLLRPRLWCLILVLVLSMVELGLLSHRPASFTLQGSGQGRWMTWTESDASARPPSVNNTYGDGSLVLQTIASSDTEAYQHFYPLLCTIYALRLGLLITACTLDLLL